ncbi:MAG: glutaredoxin family protein [Gammaproteobacteria bacterium]|nr:MAG: glutaredoxin family protein [Gammaproteobacteria bacterium]
MAAAALQLFSRRGCHLCEDFERALQAWLEVHAPGLALEVIDIDGDEDLRKRYNADVPLLMLGDRLVLQYFFESDRMAQVVRQHV